MTVMAIERGKIREFATATGAARPAYLDDPKAPVPLTFLATVVFWRPIGETVRSPEVLRARAAARSGCRPRRSAGGASRPDGWLLPVFRVRSPTAKEQRV
jgi:hypothetical protein